MAFINFFQKFILILKERKITLTTAKTNKVAQNLYENEGYVKDNEYLVYNLEIK